ncbi:DUF2948 family protein [Citreimonas salinaria]|uniref:DUF2948 domain-containing protein n=1 Tax=Citreimonas salinaria TaxID=321339 RepID=A0A1H3LN79_9RHOB|nr:DUF2948 family protein [Citreimonas salinaria]SDY65305.1 Protein of unknown function [Citreimonas salinaria]
MSQDARFEDASEAPLRLVAFDDEDLQVISALVQDSVLQGADIQWRPRERRLAFLLNRLRHEDVAAARAAGRPVERVRTVLTIEGAQHVASQGFDRDDTDTVLSVLSIAFEPGDLPAGDVIVTLAGDGAIRARVEAIEVALRDVTRPYLAPSGHVPDHGVDL